MSIKTINVQCQNCGHEMEYWTKRDYINCVECGTKIEVEPCEDLAEAVKTTEEGDTERISVYS